MVAIGLKDVISKWWEKLFFQGGDKGKDQSKHDD